MTIVIDASVALKWVLPEGGAQEAHALAQTESIATPSLLLIECANTLRTKTRMRTLSSAEAVAAYAKITAFPLNIREDTQQFVQAALAIALELDQTVYDSLYLAHAVALGCPLVTADQKFAAAAEAHPAYRAFIRRLGAD